MKTGHHITGGEIVANDVTDTEVKIDPKEIEDAEVLIKSTEIDISEAEKTGADLSEAKQFLDEAKNLLREMDIKQVKITVKKAQTAIADAKRYHRSKLLIQHAIPVVQDARRAGAEASVAESYIEKAKEALNNRMYGDLSEYVRAAKRQAKEAKRFHRAYLMIENCKTEIANAKSAGADVTEAEEYLREARGALENKDYGVVSQFVKSAKNAAIKLQKHQKVEELIAEVKPEIEDIKRFGLRTEEIEEVVREAESALQRRDYAEVRSLVRKIKRKIKRAMERKAGNVLIATIEHIIHRAKAKGLDVTKAIMLLERAKKALEKMNHPEIEQIISEVNALAREMGLPVGSLAGDLFSRAKHVDLDKIDLVFSEAERKISAEMAKARLTAMRDLMTSAKELGIMDPEFESLLNKAEMAYQSKDYDVIEECKEEFEERLEEAKIKHKTEFIGLRIKSATKKLSQFKEQGVNVDKAQELLMLAEKEFSAQNFEKAEEYIEEAEKVANELYKRSDTEHEMLSIKEVLSEAVASGVDVGKADELLNLAEQEVAASNFARARELIGQARDITSDNVQQFIQNKYPKLTVNLPESGMEAEVWNKCEIEISNIGDLIAKNIDINFRGDVEVKGVETIEKLGAGENQKMEIGVKPKKGGELDVDVMLAYQRAFDDTIYQLSVAKRIIADTKGTYAIEDVMLIHRSGVLISQASRKLEMDIDRDIFSAMFTAVQEFIKDSFRGMEEGGLNRMDFGTHKILIEHGHNIFLTTILIGGEPRYLPLYMAEVLREVEEKYGSVLEEWRGNYKEVEGIDEVIKKILQVTDEKGVDVEGFEAGVVASTIKLIEAAEASGVDLGGEDAFVAEFIKTMEKEGFDHAWGYLEKMGKEVNIGISAESARETIESMRDLLRFAKGWGVDETEFMSLLDQAEKALETRNFDIIEKYKNDFEKKLEDAKLKHKIDLILRRIKNAILMISQFKELGIDVSQPQKLLGQADQHFRENNFEGAEKDVDQAEKLAEILRKRHEIKVEIESIRETLFEIKQMQVEIDGMAELLTQAENEVNLDHYGKAKQLIEQARSETMNNIEQIIEGKFPKLSFELPGGGIEAGKWNKCIMEISNSGDLVAKNIDITLHGNVDVKGIESIDKLPPGDTNRMEIGILPKEVGEVNTEVLLTYQRAFDETIYQLDLTKKFNVEPIGTYNIEDVFLIHNNGVLISQVGRKLDEDVDKDIFSGMLTAIQEFIKDSFKRRIDIGLKRMDFGPNKILIEHGSITFLTTVLSGGEPKLLPLYMLEVLKEVEAKYGDVLKKWDGTYRKLGGLNDILQKLIQVTDAKGTEVEGFESGAVASTIKLIETAKDEGVEIVAPETFANKIVELIEEEGFENAWKHLQKMGEDVEQTSTEYRIKMKGIEELKQAFLTDMDDHMVRDIGDSLENYLTIADDIIKFILVIRDELGIKNTTPIKRLAIKSQDEHVKDAVTKLRTPILKKVNAKELEVVEPDKDWQGLKLEVIPNRDTIIYAYKQQASKVESLLKHQSPWKIKNALEKTGEYTLGVEGYPVKITQKMLEFKLSVPENIVVKEHERGTIYIDRELTEEMKSESIAEELIEHIIDMRTTLNIGEEDYIETQVLVEDKTVELLEKFKDHIASKTLSYALEFPFENIFENEESGYYVEEREIGGKKATIGIVVVEWEESSDNN